VSSNPEVTTLGDLLLRTAASSPDLTAIWTPTGQLSYGELAIQSAALASALRGYGFEPGALIAMVMPNVVESLVTFFGVAMAGYRLLPIGPRLQEGEINVILERWAPPLVLCGGTTKEGSVGEKVLSLSACPPTAIWAGQEGEKRPGRSVKLFASLLEDGARGANSVTRQRTVGPDDDCLIQLTSGTTALPKGVRLSHGQCTRMGFEVARRHGLRRGDRYFGGNPNHHLGWTNFVLMPSIAAGATIYTMPNFQADEALDILARERCTVKTGVPAHYLLEMQSPNLNPGQLALRTLTVGGGPPVAMRVREAFQNDGVVQRYGASESGGAPICGRFDDPLETRLNTFGSPLPGIEIRIVNPENGADLPANAEGEIQLRGWSLMRGYAGDPEATGQVIDPDGWFRTGDRGLLRDDGRLIFFGRLRDVLRVGGENVAATEIEAMLERHPSVHKAHVVPVPHPILNEIPAAFVELKRDAACDVEDLKQLCAANLARFKRPAHIWFVDNADLPVTETGKVRKSELTEMAVRRLASGSMA
jgi:fatty-acyl-CoA synthase